MSLLRVESLRTSLEGASGAVRAVDDVSFEIAAGETFALLGESGCGKSMTALSMMRLLPDAGSIAGGRVMLNGRDLLALPEAEMRTVRGREMAMIFQEPATSLNPVLTVGRQIGEVLARHTPLRGAAARRRSVELIEAVGIPDAARRLDEFPFQFSGGMKQRVMIAMALAGDPALLIADEPTTALDVTIQAQVLEQLGALQRSRGMGMLLITHDLGIVAQLAQRVGVMYAGELVEVAAQEVFFAAPRHPYAQKLFAALPLPERRGRALETIPGSVPLLNRPFAGCRFVERCAQAWPRCREEPPAWHAAAAGQAVRCHLYDRASGLRHRESGVPVQASDTRCCAAGPSLPVGSGQEAGAALLEVSDLRVHFPIRRGVLRRTVGQVRAVDGVSLGLTSGRTLALVGESGCGKTTAGKAILQLIEPTAGSVRYRGKELTALSAARLRALRGEMQIVFQDPYASLDPRMRVGDIIEEGMAALGTAAATAQRERRTAELLERVGLSADMRGRYPHEFSGGQRQRIAIARALAVAPRLLVCDEPTSALDVSVQAQILNLLKELQISLGLAYLFITHNIAVVEYLAQAVAVMYLGRIVERGSVEEVLGSPQHPYTQALLSAVPRLDAAQRREVIVLGGDMPSPARPPAGCHFHPRCPRAMPQCAARYPDETLLGATHAVRCFLHG
ncbi:MAG: ABC transporter ATP-binding protein [Zoogloeaceae bacterium]|nr:ABC transporter ATP-binding protein [Zoogloeaceae bacterium]MCK6384401.1 ABC transporter ATP-binding protein [Rhodocyclaceae bacterium]